MVNVDPDSLEQQQSMGSLKINEDLKYWFRKKAVRFPFNDIQE